MRSLIANIVSAFVPGRARRDMVRVKLRYPTRKYIEFVRQYLKNPHVHISTHIGRGCHNYIVVADKKWVFKFSLRPNNHDAARRLARLCDEFARVAPCNIRVPHINLIPFEDILVQQYEFIPGRILGNTPPPGHMPAGKK